MQTVSRLYKQFKPTNYKIHWDLTKTKSQKLVTGRVKISGSQTGDKDVVLHAKGLKILDVRLNDATTNDWELKPEADELVITSTTKGKVEIDIKFELSLTDSMHGVYPCYFESAGKPDFLVATQFESHHAREAMPCIDEPEAKATFDVTITADKSHAVLSNTNPSKTTQKDDRQTVVFETTPIMSSYLLAFVVGNMHSKSTKTSRGIDVNVWATPAQTPESLDFALSTARDLIDFYEQYFGVDYPLEKSDHVALPDFSSGAMENWGLITYREVCLLADPKTSGISAKQLVAGVIAHELAHQWFGNLVTMRWWDNLWLNESFADFVEHIAIDQLFPDWETWLEFSSTRGIAALRRDAINGVQSVEMAVNHPDEIATIFDGAIVYGKGARLMKMLWRYVGDEAFRAGLKNYFMKHAYKNTVGDDLWRELSLSSGLDVKTLMDPWIKTPGYPVVSATPNKLTQQRFFIGDHPENDQLWPIPLNPNKAGDLPELFESQSINVSLQPGQKLNHDDTSHYIANYSEELQAEIFENISKLSSLDRLTSIHELTLLIRGGLRSSSEIIDAIPHYADETNPAVWSITSLAFTELKQFVEPGSQAESALKRLAVKLASKQFSKIGLTELLDEDIDTSKLRPTLLGLMLYGEDKPTVDQTLETFNSTKIAELPPETRPLILSAAVRFSTDPQKIIDDLMTRYKSTSSAEIKEDIVIAVTSMKDPSSATKLLDSARNKDVIRPQDFAPWFIYLIRNRWTRDAAWQWLRDNWGWIEQTYSGDKSYNEYPRYAASGLHLERHQQEFNQFFSKYRDLPALKRTIDMGNTEISSRISLLKRDTASVIEKLLSISRN